MQNSSSQLVKLLCYLGAQLGVCCQEDLHTALLITKYNKHMSFQNEDAENFALSYGTYHRCGHARDLWFYLIINRYLIISNVMCGKAA